MENQIEYKFPNEQLAYRFLNTVRNRDLDGGRVGLGKSNRHVKVSYRLSVGQFDTTLSELDDLARGLEGQEV